MCGYAVEWSRSCFTSSWRLFRNRPDVLTSGRFFFAPDDTPFYPGAHLFFSRDWVSDEIGEDWLGEVKGASRRYSKGSLGLPHPPPILVGERRCIAEGDTFPPDQGGSLLARGINSRCWTDAGLPFPGDAIGEGGVKVNGAAVVYWSPVPPSETFCDVLRWCLQWTADPGVWADFVGNHTMEVSATCQWFATSTVGTVTYRAFLFETGTPGVASLTVNVYDPYPSNLIATGSWVATDPWVPPAGSLTLFRSSASGVGSPAVVTVPYGACATGTTVEGQAGIEMDGEAFAQSNSVIGQGGAEADGEAVIGKVDAVGEGGAEADGEAEIIT